MKIKIFTTGGTIDKIYFDQKSVYQVGDAQAGSVLQRANVVIDYDVESVFRKDSLDMTEDDRLLLLERIHGEPCDRIVVTHGTDSMVDTAKVLWEVKEKTIVLTGSMYPAEFRDSDAIFNIGGAVVAVQTLPPGVYIVMNGRVFNPLTIKKNVEMNRFDELK